MKNDEVQFDVNKIPHFLFDPEELGTYPFRNERPSGFAVSFEFQIVLPFLPNQM